MGIFPEQQQNIRLPLGNQTLLVAADDPSEADE